MKKLTFIATLLYFSNVLFAQDNVGIGTLTPNVKSVLDLSSNTKGFLAPRMSTTERLAIAPSTSEAALMVFDTDLSRYLYWDGTQWVEFPSAGDDWSLTGNAGTNVANNYIGTSDATGLSIRTNATERIRITAQTGFVGIGTTPSYPLDVLNQTRITRANASIANTNESNLELFNGSAGDVYISFHKAGVWGAHFGLDATNWFSTQGWSAGAGYTNLRTGSMQVNGSIQITGGVPQAGFILQSNDAAGNASWVSSNTVVNNVNNSNNYNILPTGSHVGLCVRNTNDGCCNCNAKIMAPITGWGSGCPAGYTFEQIAARWNGLNERWVYACIKN